MYFKRVPERIAGAPITRAAKAVSSGESNYDAFSRKAAGLQQWTGAFRYAYTLTSLASKSLRTWRGMQHGVRRDLCVVTVVESRRNRLRLVSEPNADVESVFTARKPNCDIVAKWGVGCDLQWNRKASRHDHLCAAKR